VLLVRNLTTYSRRRWIEAGRLMTRATFQCSLSRNTTTVQKTPSVFSGSS